MKSTNRLKDEARKHEQREEWDRAIQLYLQVLRSGDDGDADVDLPLYNRVGDLYVRLGRPNDAVTYYEQAADRYADAGLYNNAIALCNKALRYQPNRLALFRKLGQFCAQQGFLTDARRWYLEFADRTFRLQQFDDAFAALSDFADISEDPDVRVHLARKLHEHGRSDDALTEFLRSWQALLHSGRNAAADALQDDVRELLPEAQPLSELRLDARRPADTDQASSDLPTYGDNEARPTPGPMTPASREPGRADAPGTPEATGDEPVHDEETTPASGMLEGLEQTQLADESSLRGVNSSALAGLDTGRDDTLERLHEESAPALPLLDGDSEAAEETEQGRETASGLAGLPLLGDEPVEADPATERAQPGDPLGVGSLGVRGGDEPSASAPADDSGYVDLYALLAPDEDRVETTRFFVQETEPTGDEDHDFAELLNQFRAKLAEHVPENDAGSHYDLGLAFKEMELYDDAISEFQIALRAGQDRLKVFEELGQCFIQKRQYNVAVKVLARALQFEHRDENELIGVYYFLGEAYEQLGQTVQARDSYERVLGLDLRFRDVQQRVARL